MFHLTNYLTLLFAHISSTYFSLCTLVVLLMPASFVARIMAGRGFVEEGWGDWDRRGHPFESKIKHIRKIVRRARAERMESRGQVCSGSVQLGSVRFPVIR